MADGVYSASSAHHAFFHGLLRFPCGKLIWKAWAPGKCRLHVWPLLHERFWTTDYRLWHALLSHVACPLYDQAHSHRSPSCGLPLHARGLVRVALPV
jgi:hypothetical protein